MITGSSNNAQQSTPRKASTQQSTAAPAPTSQQITAVQGILQSPVPRDMHRHASAGGSITVAQPHTDTSDLHQIDDVHDVPNGSARASGAAGGGRGASEDPRYPADLNGFLSGITQSLMNVSAWPGVSCVGCRVCDGGRSTACVGTAHSARASHSLEHHLYA